MTRKDITTKLWRQRNKDKVAAMDARKKAKLKTKHYSLYYMPEEHYIGVTNQLTIRMVNHRCKNKITEGYEVISTFSNKKEALKVEKLYHSIGYIGGRDYSHLKQYQNKLKKD